MMSMKFYVKMPHVQRFLCLVMMAMLLFGISGMIEAMDNIAGAAAKSVVKEGAEAATKTVSKEFAEATLAASRRSLGAALKVGGGKINQEMFESFAKKMADDLIESGLQGADELAEGGFKTMMDASSKTISKQVDNLTKIMDTVVTKANIPDLVKALDGMGVKNADDVAKNMIHSKAALIDGAQSTTMKSIKSFFGLSDDATKYMGRVEMYTQNKAWLKTGDYATQKAARKTLAKLDRSATMNFAIKYGDRGE